MIRWLKWGGILLLAAGVLTAIAVAVGRRSPELPNPNGWDQLVAISAMMPRNHGALATNGEFADPVRHAVASDFNLVAKVLVALELPSRVPIGNSGEKFDRHWSGLVGLRELEAALSESGRQSEVGENVIGAISAYLAIIRLGQQECRGGLLMHYTLGTTTQINGLKCLTNTLPRMDSKACQLALGELRALRSGGEPLADYVARTRRWMLLNGNWWRDWTTAKELSRMLLNLESQPGGNGKTPRTCSEELDATFAQVEAALVGRLSELNRQNGGVLGR